MLDCWTVTPDAAFHSAVAQALTLAVHYACFGDEWLRRCFPYSAKVFTAQEIRRLLRLIHEAHQDESTLYSPTDYHRRLIYEALYAFCEIHNESVALQDEDEEADVTQVGPYQIGFLDVDEMVGYYFADLDFLDESFLDVPSWVREAAGVRPETCRLLMGLKPDPEDLVLTPVTDAGSPPFRPRPGPKRQRLAQYPPARWWRAMLPD